MKYPLWISVFVELETTPTNLIEYKKYAWEMIMWAEGVTNPAVTHAIFHDNITKQS